MKTITKKLMFVLVISAVLLCAACITVSADNGESREVNIFQECFGAVKSHSTELLSALAFAGSLIIAFTYKKGLLPTIKKSIGAIGAAVCEIKESDSASNLLQEKISKELEDGLKALSEYIKSVDEKLVIYEQILKNLNTGATQAEKTEAVISEQVSLLYDVFMFSSIPEYQKDAIGHRVEKMRKLIAEKEVSESEADA